MDTNNLDKWWYGLPENTRQAIGNLSLIHISEPTRP